MSGAELVNLMNYAALNAAEAGLDAITMEVLECVKDKMSKAAFAVIPPRMARCVAYHEAGHAIVAVLTKSPIHSATIVPYGSAFGMVITLSDPDQTPQSLHELKASMEVDMGGRAAEELIFGKEQITSASALDIHKATRIARDIVTKYGFSDEIGIVFHGGSAGEESASSETRALIDAEVKRLTEAAYNRAKEFLTKHSLEHKLLAETLLEYEALTGEEVRDVVLKQKKPARSVL
jgi:ATP-dependent metalloprotease